MSWWKRLWTDAREPAALEGDYVVRLDMQGWTEQPPDVGLRVWRNLEGDVLSFAVLEFRELPELSDELALRKWARQLAESRGAGLIEVNVGKGPSGPTVALIYKRLDVPAYIFTGMLFILYENIFQVWTIVAEEHGTTGIREALVAGELLSAGDLTIEDYERSWAQDPYDPNYRGVDRSVLRFVSDDQSYDSRFPQHPLSRTRSVLAKLPSSFQVSLRFR